MSEKDVCSDKKVVEIIWNKEEINSKQLNKLLYRLFHASDNCDTDSLQRYTHLGWYDYDKKMSKIVSFIHKFLPYLAFYDTKGVNKDESIIEMVGVLPNIKLQEFIDYIHENYFIEVYFEEDNVYGCDYLLDILLDTEFGRALDELKQEEINEIVNFINDLDLFDVELFKLYNKE